MRNMRWRTALLTLAVVPCAACDLAEAISDFAHTMVEEARLVRAVEGLEVGTPEDQVLKRLSQPSDSGTKFYLGQVDGFEAEYRAAAESPSVRYLFWRGGIDVVCAVGFDRHKRLSYRACGGT
jgi:hypothetical protein